MAEATPKPEAQAGLQIMVQYVRDLSFENPGAPNFAAVYSDCRVIGHVLRLEGRDAQATVSECTRQTRHQKRLADIRAGALDHHCTRHATSEKKNRAS